MRTYAEYKEMYPDKTDAQIIELLDWELGEKVQEIGRLLLELNANKDGWVSCLQGLPEQEEGFFDCLIARTDDVVHQARFNCKTQHFQNMQFEDIHNSVRFWMPLPPKPQI